MDYSLFRKNLRVVLAYGDLELCIKASLNHDLFGIEQRVTQLDPKAIHTICIALGVDMDDMINKKAVPTFKFED